jgi:hypothetical protein
VAFLENFNHGVFHKVLEAAFFDSGHGRKLRKRSGPVKRCEPAIETPAGLRQANQPGSNPSDWRGAGRAGDEGFQRGPLLDVACFFMSLAAGLRIQPPQPTPWLGGDSSCRCLHV